MEKREQSYTDGGNTYWYSHCGKQYGSFSKELKKKKVPYDPEIPILGIYPKKRKTHQLEKIHIPCNVHSSILQLPRYRSNLDFPGGISDKEPTEAT